MGEANAAWADDVYGMHFNPAGIAAVRRQEVGFAHNTLFLDLDYDYVGYLHPLGDASSLAVSGTYVDLGTFERREIVAGGGSSAVLGSASAYDLSFSVTYARTLSEIIDLGGSVKVIHETLDNYSASAVAVDLGAKWRPPIEGLTVGLSVLNLGSSLKFVSAGDELPITVRAGAGYRSINGRWGLNSDIVYVKNQDIEGGIGGELWVWPDHVAFRAGANSANDAGSGFTVGAGFKWNDIILDYAYVPFGDLGDQNLISLSYQFGSTHGAQPKRSKSTERTNMEHTSVERGRMDQTVAEPAGAGHARTDDVRPAANRMPEDVLPMPAPWGIALSPFVYRSGPSEFEWIGGATSEVLAKGWKARGWVNPVARSARFTVDGECWVVGRALILAARLSGPGFLFEASVGGDVGKPFLAWRELQEKINVALHDRGLP